MAERASTPPRPLHSASLPSNPVTPEHIRRTEEARLRAKALRAEQDASKLTTATTTPSGFPISGQKRPHSAISGSLAPPSTSRDATLSKPPADDVIRPAKKFEKFIEYDFSKMTDTKGGFITSEDDPFNKALHADGTDPVEQKPANMTLKEWERHQLLKKLRASRAGPFEPGISVLAPAEKSCRECGSLEIDWGWEDIFGCRVCNGCKEKHPDKYSLLTKTEAREDYLLTDEELKDPELLPHMERPNPHKATWNNMMLYLRYQVEEYAFSEKKWGSPEALDAEFERREAEKKKRKDQKFKTKLLELKKKTRVEAYRRSRTVNGASEAKFGDRVIGRNDRHEHEWGRPVTDPETGMTKKRCMECGMECEELEL
jgi:DNA-repair protein complementing XP-A cells